MASKSQIKFVNELLKKLDIIVNGNRPWDIKVHNEKVYDYVITGDSLLLGESYIVGMWDCEQLDVMANKLFSSDIIEKVDKNWRVAWHYSKAKFFNYANKKRAFVVGQKHYDLGNDLYEAMLDKRMVYTCGYWTTPNGRAKNLDEAQENKLDLICRKINLQKNQKILDIGGGWGSFAKFAAEKYGSKVVNITVSKEQVKLANERCKDLPVENRLQDYRDVKEKFDHLVSIGMFEHVGYKNYREFFEIASKNLEDNGLFLLHTIGNRVSQTNSDPWIEKYIFPNSMIPSLAQITSSIEGYFIVEDVHNFGADYDTTLMEWYKNFEKNWETLRENPVYDEKFYRMWRFYLLICAASFRSRSIQLWQIVLSKKGVRGVYKTVR